MKNLMTLTALLLLAGAASATDNGRRYDSKGNFEGTYTVTPGGGLRLYDSKGNFEGTVVPRSDGEGYRRYDGLGNYEGNVEGAEEDESDE